MGDHTSVAPCTKADRYPNMLSRAKIIQVCPVSLPNYCKVVIIYVRDRKQQHFGIITFPK